MRHAIMLAIIVSLLAAPAAILAGSCDSSCRTTSCDTRETVKPMKSAQGGPCPVTGACSCTPSAKPAPVKSEAPVPSLIQPHKGLINTPGLLALIQSRAPVVILDARSAKWDDGKRIPGAKSLTSEAGLADIRKYVKSQDQLIVTYCGGLTCPASKNLSEHLKKLGFKNVLEYPEGIKGWVEAGHPVENAKK